ncbi:MAG: nucleoside hydrolase [Aristaeellaceae bacterium]
MQLPDFTVPESKRVRMIIDTDCKNEADDQYALTHHLLTPMLDIRGIIAAHFETNAHIWGEHQTVHASYDEILRVMNLMDMTGKYPVVLGADRPMPDEQTPVPSAGAQLIIDEAMREDERPLFVGLLGTSTDLASALLMEPRIAERLTVIWIGGGDYPHGCWEFNLAQDIHAANVMMASRTPLWQVPRQAYKQMNVTLSELRYRVAPYGKIGRYLFEQLAEFSARVGAGKGAWPHGESWCLGDQPTVGLLLEDRERDNYDLLPAPRIAPDFSYQPLEGSREIRVYHTIDTRMILEDFYCKLALFAMERGEISHV